MSRDIRKGRNAIIEPGGDSIQFENLDGRISRIYLEASGEFIDGEPSYYLIFDEDTATPGNERVIVRTILKQNGSDFFTADEDDISKIYISYRISDTDGRDQFQVIDLFTMVKLRN